MLLAHILIKMKINIKKKVLEIGFNFLSNAALTNQIVPFNWYLSKIMDI